MPWVRVLLAVAALAGSTWACECQGTGRDERLVIAPGDFTELEGARVVDAEGTPSGTAVLVEQPDGFAAITLKLGEDGVLPQGLYDVSLLLGTRDGQLKWAALHCFPGGWFTGFVSGRGPGDPPGEPGKWQWHERTQPLPIAGSEQLVLQVRSKGETDLYVGAVTLERTAPYWPKEMISDEEFFGGLDRDYPGLGPVVAAADAGDYDRACAAFIEYLRRNPRKAEGRLGGVVASGPAETTGEPPSEVARLLLEDKMTLVWDPHEQPAYCTDEAHKIPPTLYSFADPHDWHSIYDDPGRRWYGWFLYANLSNLTQAYTTTGDERFARKAMDLVNRCIEQWGPFPKAFYSEGGYPNQYYTKGSFGKYSRSSGFRHGLVEGLWDVIRATGGCAGITDRERVEALKLALIMTRFVQNVRDYQNGVHPKYVWLIQAGNWLPELREVVEMSDNAPWGLMSFMDDCHYPDGAYNELCYYRHGRFAEAARDAAAQGKDMSKYLAKFRKCFDFNLWMTKPMGNDPWINDAGSGQQVDYAEPAHPGGGVVGIGAALYPDDPYLKYAVSFGEEGEPPQPTSRNFPWCGFMVMRTGWRPEDLHLILDGGRNTGSHNHQDQMNIVVTAYGSTLLCDDGYVGTGFSAPDRAYYISHPRGHNLLKVDDMAQTPNSPATGRPQAVARQSPGANPIGWRAWGNEPLDNYWLSAEGYDYAETVYDRRYRRDYEKPATYFEPARQERRVLFLKPRTGTPYWVVYDLVQAKGQEAGEHNLQLLFHFTPTSSAQVIEGGRAVRGLAEHAGLLILPRSDRPWSASIVKGEARPEENYWQGFVSGGFGNPLVPTDCAIFEHNGPLPAAVATVLYPYPGGPGGAQGGEQAASADLLPASRDGAPLPSDRALGLEVALAGGRDTVLACAEPGTMTRFGDLAFDGRVAAIRREAAGNIVSILMVEATVLRSGEQTLVDLGGRRARYLECGRGEGIAAEGVALTVEGLSVLGLEWAPDD
jgi:hypothetical protein